MGYSALLPLGNQFFLGQPVVLGEGRRPRRVRDVDFSRPTKFTPDQQRRFERAHESFCRGSSTRLSTELRNPLLIEVVDSVTYVARSPDGTIGALVDSE